MRRSILSEKSKKSRKKFYSLLFGILLITILILSIAGYSLRGSSNQDKKEINYNGYEFIEKEGFWLLNLEESDIQLAFRYNPYEVPRIDGIINNVDNYYNKPLYIQSQNNLATSEIYSNMANIAQRVQNACLNKSEHDIAKEIECDEDLPIKNCESNLILIKQGNITNIKQEQNCVFITAPKNQIIKVADEFLFKLLRID